MENLPSIYAQIVTSIRDYNTMFGTNPQTILVGWKLFASLKNRTQIMGVSLIENVRECGPWGFILGGGQTDGESEIGNTTSD